MIKTELVGAVKPVGPMTEMPSDVLPTPRMVSRAPSQRPPRMCALRGNVLAGDSQGSDLRGSPSVCAWNIWPEPWLRDVAELVAQGESLG